MERLDKLGLLAEQLRERSESSAIYAKQFCEAMRAGADALDAIAKIRNELLFKAATDNGEYNNGFHSTKYGKGLADAYMLVDKMVDEIVSHITCLGD